MAVFVLSRKQGTALLLFAQRFRQLQIPACGGIQQHVFVRQIRIDMGKMRQTGFLCIIQILHQTARRDQAVRKFLEAKTDQRRDMEMLLQAFAAQIFIKIVRIEGINRDMQPVSPDLRYPHRSSKRVVADDFRRMIFVDFIQQHWRPPPRSHNSPRL